MTIKIFQVGGSVRDEIIGTPSNDIDYAIEADSYETMKRYIESNGSIFLETPEYFTIRAIVGGVVSDYVLCRKDGEYTDGRRPDSVEIGTIYDDLARRDFTMNAIAKSIDGELVDPFNGKGDIHNKIVRCVGKTSDRIQEDYLRLLRAVRFSLTKGFKIHPEIVEMIHNTKVVKMMAKTVSEERIKDELHKMFKYNSGEAVMIFSNYPELTKEVFSGKIWIDVTNKKKGR